MKITNIMKKNLKLIFKSKLTLLLIIFGPLLIILIVGMVFESKNELRINVGYYTPSDSEHVDSLTEMLSSSNFGISRYDKITECVNELKINREQICIEFPSEIKFEGGHVNEIKFHADNSKMHLFGPVIDAIDSQFTKKSLEISGYYTTDILNRMDYIKEKTTKSKPVLANFSKRLNALSSDLVSLNEELKNMDITFTSGSTDMSELEDSIENVDKESNNLNSAAREISYEMDDLMNDVNGKIDDVIDLLEDENLSQTDAVAIETRVDEAEDVYSGFDSSMTSAYDDLSDVIAELDEFSSSLGTKISADKERLDAADKKRDELVVKLNKIISDIEESKAHIDTINEVLDLIDMQIEGTLVKDSEAIIQPFKKTTVPLSAKDNQVGFIFPYLVMLVVMFMSLLLSSILIMNEKKSNALFRNFVTPTNDLVFMLGNFLTLFIIISLQAAVIMGLFSYYFNQDIITNLSATLLILTGSMALFVLLGMAITYLLSNEQTSTLVAIAIGSIFLFLSDLISPLEMIPESIANMIYWFNPFVLGSELLRNSMIYHIHITLYAKQLALLSLYAVILFCLMFLVLFIKRQQLSFYFSGHNKAEQEEKKRIKLEKEQNLVSIMNNISKDDGFITKNNKTAVNIKELIALIQEMKPEEFLSHVSEQHNEVADWISSVLQNDELSNETRKCVDKKSMIKELKNGQKYYDKLKKSALKEKNKMLIKSKID